eukprot:gene13739-biopygen3538
MPAAMRGNGQCMVTRSRSMVLEVVQRTGRASGTARPTQWHHLRPNERELLGASPPICYPVFLVVEVASHAWVPRSSPLQANTEFWRVCLKQCSAPAALSCSAVTARVANSGPRGCHCSDRARHLLLLFASYSLCARLAGMEAGF